MEDYSINSSIHKSAISKDDSVEESGWTAYFEDFSNNNHHQQQQDSYSYSFDCGSSLISDAATAWKSPHNIDHHHHVFPKKLRFKKTRTKEIYEEDDSLEDTASSPVNSPKVSDELKPNDMNPRKREDQAHSSLGKETATDIQIEEENKLKFRYGKNDCTELNKRGLCLVPFSMLANYLG
ncbi:hypothetical protein Goshw_017299 [Gossypium schwendimanii]|uniref:Uncharacterized protein n=4 Tax=Gossypium TaxID=3633 RepID=A0A0D2T1S4_GOSRA|nr:vascular-related unknown protein 1 [Gossypium raimondii]MBA0563319.1 hypothetical protein [Gossypium lobatum]MBA0689161.1 hypothetical protein [Gossypium aridum]MBA0863143.1 hypothetical protein [Gossypium schwendimanii]KJB50394.1 hypothetical protein B456_008G172600 [Gossypium raimondii]MBA0592835.1 hypothetical protein [Gossypium raimondii]